MLPFLDLKIIKLPMYGLCIAFGIFIAGFISYKLIKRQKKDFDYFIMITVIAICFGFVFAKLMFILVSYPLSHFFKILWDTISNLNNPSTRIGFVFYGGLIGGILGYITGCKIAKVPLKEYVNIFGVAIPIAHGFGRIGCFCAGCCYGIPYDGLCAVHYHNPITLVPTGIGIFPVQLLEATLLFILGFCLYFHEKNNKKHTILLYISCYSIIRFLTEFFRFDKERGFILGLSVSQFISLIFFVLTILSYIFLKIDSKKKKNPIV